MALRDRIAITTNEINADFEAAMKIGVEWGVRNFELRDIWGRPTRIPRVTPEQEKIIYDTFEKYGVTCTALSPGIFRDVFTPESVAEDFGHLEKCFDMSDRLGTNMIIPFSFKRFGAPAGEVMPADMVEVLREAAQRAQDRGKILALENMDGQWADTPENTKQVLEQVDHPAFLLNYDPASAAYSGGLRAFPEGYELLQGWLVHFHLKNLKRDGEEKIWVRLAEGEIDYQSHIKKLLEDGYNGYFLIETHCPPFEENSKANLAYLRSILDGLE